MASGSSILGIFLVLWLGSTNAEPEFCHRGFQIASKYHSCWGDATYQNPYKGFDSIQLWTPELLQDYATHMCSIVKPVAMECLRQETEACSEQEKLLNIADESGGACFHSELNPNFKTFVIDHLKPIPRNSSCFTIGQSSYDCYVKAGQNLMSSGISHVGISHFHQVADKFFSYIWDCHIDVFKSSKDRCEDWQLPMLLSLQKTAMPSLFGMHLSFDQIKKLELNPESKQHTQITPTTTTESPDENEGENEEKDVSTFLLIRVIKNKKEAQPGDIVIQLDSNKDERELSVVSGPSFDEDVHEIVEQLLDENGLLDMQKVRKKMREDRKKQKEIQDYLKRIRAGEKNSEKDAKKQRRMRRMKLKAAKQ